MTTFISFAERAKIVLHGYHSEAEGVLELVEGGFRFTRVVIRPKVKVLAGQVDQAKQVLQDAHAKCLVSNSMRCEVVVEPSVDAA